MNNSSEFALNQLKKFGWKSGEGLGKRKHGIIDPVKASMKFSRRGLGYSFAQPSDENFWSNIYQEAVSHISGTLEPPEDVLSVQTPHMSACQKPKFIHSAGSTNPEGNGQVSFIENTYTSGMAKEKYVGIKFECQAVLSNGQELSVTGSQEDPLVVGALEFTNKAADLHDSNRIQSCKSLYKQPFYTPSDSSLLELGQGRTGHPAARFGIRCGGKLSRASKFL